MADYDRDSLQSVKGSWGSTDVATENGKIPDCDDRMLTGITQKLLVCPLDILEYQSILADIVNAACRAPTKKPGKPTQQ